MMGQVVVHVDFQFFLLLSLQLKRVGTVWLWLDRQQDTRRWLALRRAVFSSDNARANTGSLMTTVSAGSPEAKV